MTEQKEMLYRLSFYPFIDVDYAETVFPGSSEILNALSRNFRSCILKLGGFFCFHPDFHEVAEKYLDNVVEIGEQDKTYVEYLYSTGQYDRALEGTIRLKDKKEYVQKIATGLIISGMEYYLFNVFIYLCNAIPNKR